MNEEMSVLKKAGIVAAVATAGVLALSPLAFAQGNGNGDGDGDRDRGGNSSTGFSFEDNSVERNQVNLCSFDQDYNGEPGELIPGILPLVSQDQNYDCVNVGDRSDYTAPAEELPPAAAAVALVPGI
jgi:hypothetical protein